MKNTVYLLILFCIGNIFAQNNDLTNATTLEEYNYLTQGYKISLENGSDFKKGYELKKYDEDKYAAFTITYHLFIHTETKKTKAILIIISKDKSKKDKEEYLCLPINNDDLFKKFIDKTYEIGLNMKHYFGYSTYKILSKSIDKLVN